MARIKSIIRTDNATGRVVDAVLTVPTQVVSVTPIPRVVGLGDLIEVGAKPVARWIDRETARLPWKRAHTRLAGCSACSRRRAWLNRLMPSVRRPWRLYWPGWPCAAALQRLFKPPAR